jgi:TolA-binding protein
VAYQIGSCYEEIDRPDSARLFYRRSLSRLSTPEVTDGARFRLSLIALADTGPEAALRLLDSPLPGIRDRLGVPRRIVEAYALGGARYEGLAIRLLRTIGSTGTAFSCDALLLASDLVGIEDADVARGILQPGEDVCGDIFGVSSLLRERARMGCATASVEICQENAGRYRDRFPLDRRTQTELELMNLLQQFKEGDAGSAVTVLDSLIAAGIDDPLVADALYKKGVHLLVKSDYLGATGAFKRIERDYPGSALYYDACFKLGTAYYMNEIYDSSAFYFNIASRSDKPSLVENALFNGGLALDKYGDLDGAAETLRQLALRFPLSQRFERSLMRVAYARERSGRFRDAIKMYENLLHYTVTSEAAAEAHYWIGEAYAGLGEHLRAAVEFLRCAHLYPQEAAWAGTAAFQAGIECERAGLVDHAFIVYRENVRRFGTGSDWGGASAERLAELEAAQRKTVPEGPPTGSDAEGRNAQPDREK